MEHLPKSTAGHIGSVLEKRTSRFPVSTFLWAAGGAIAASMVLRQLNRRHDALFVGLWAPTLLLLGLYAKVAKLLRD